MYLQQADAWLRLAAERLHEQAGSLTELDQAIGDGDHGINMDRGFTAIVAMLDGQPAPNGSGSGQALSGLLRQAGQTLIRTVGGASGPLYGTAFLRAAAVFARAEEPSVTDTVAALRAAAEGIGALGRSITGEKTMLDALVPAATAAQAALDAGGDDRAVVAAAREAAEAGAQATIPMLATKGRASYLGERSIGHQDPGATSAALLVGALAAVLAR
ncbi:MAG TPA: dihydroxyacetone kinase subunit DhaL [Chloroflexota bacterium]|nr:dihydroxyacetone kinase subunit DhaL [Chloroflexota bacterium]